MSEGFTYHSTQIHVCHCRDVPSQLFSCYWRQSDHSPDIVKISPTSPWKTIQHKIYIKTKARFELHCMMSPGNKFNQFLSAWIPQRSRWWRVWRHDGARCPGDHWTTQRQLPACCRHQLQRLPRRTGIAGHHPTSACCPHRHRRTSPVRRGARRGHTLRWHRCCWSRTARVADLAVEVTHSCCHGLAEWTDAETSRCGQTPTRANDRKHKCNKLCSHKQNLFTSSTPPPTVFCYTVDFWHEHSTAFSDFLDSFIFVNIVCPVLPFLYH